MQADPGLLRSHMPQDAFSYGKNNKWNSPVNTNDYADVNNANRLSEHLGKLH